MASKKYILVEQIEMCTLKIVCEFHDIVWYGCETLARSTYVIHMNEYICTFVFFNKVSLYHQVCFKSCFIITNNIDDVWFISYHKYTQTLYVWVYITSRPNMHLSCKKADDFSKGIMCNTYLTRRMETCSNTIDLSTLSAVYSLYD